MVPPRRSDRGVALVAVLLLVAGLIAIATAIVVLSVSQRRTAQRAHEAALRREILDGALRVALAEIAFGKPDGPYWHPRAPRFVEIGGRRVEVSLEREAGRIDLNTADERYVVAGLVAAGKTEADARAGAARIRDWIDPDDAVTARIGAERDDYRRAGLSYQPRNGPMESVEEIRQVLGLADLADPGLDAFTIYSQQLEPAPGESPPATRAALDWLARSAGQGGTHAPLEPAAPPSPNDPVSYAGSVVRLRACLADERDAPCRMTVQRVTGSARQPFLVFMWR